MTQKFTNEKIPLFLMFAFIQAISIYLAITIFLNPELILKDKEVFCGIVLFLSVLLLFFNIIQTYIITEYIINDLKTQKSTHGQSQNTENKKSPERKNFKNIGLSILQIFFGLSFSISGISLTALIFFKKIDDKTVSLLGRIHCGVFAISTISMIVLSLISTTIGYFYSKDLIKNNSSFEDIKENKILKICNFFHNIANIFASINLYACHLFIIEEKFQANKIYFYEKNMKNNIEIKNQIRFNSIGLFLQDLTLKVS